MRRFDKKKNISKVNLLAEQRHLNSKGLIKEGINELDIDTYAKQLDNTGDYGQTTFSSNEPNKYDNPRQKGNKQKRVNRLSREGFEKEFYKAYPVDVTKLVSETGTYFFKNIKWESNYSSYSLQFISESGESHLYIKSDTSSPKGYYIEFNKKPNLSPGAEELIRKMFSHNMNYRNKSSDSLVKEEEYDFIRDFKATHGRNPSSSELRRGSMDINKGMENPLPTPQDTQDVIKLPNKELIAKTINQPYRFKFEYLNDEEQQLYNEFKEQVNMITKALIKNGLFSEESYTDGMLNSFNKGKLKHNQTIRKFIDQFKEKVNLFVYKEYWGNFY